MTVNMKELRALVLLSCRGYAIASSSDDRMNEPPTSLGLVPHQVSDLEMKCGPAPSSLEGKVGHHTPAAAQLLQWGLGGENVFWGHCWEEKNPWHCLTLMLYSR